MSTYNSAPRPELLGIRDVSGRTAAPTPEQIATHCPFFFTYAERGGVDAELVDGASAIQYYGESTFEYDSPFANHQTPFINRAFTNANASFVKRIIPDDAPPPAAVRLSLDILETQVPLWLRNPDGTFQLDINGERIQATEDDGSGNDVPVTIPGIKPKWVATMVDRRNSEGVIITPAMIAAAETDPEIDIVPVTNAIGAGSVTQGDQVDVDTSTVSTRLPIYEAEVPWVGLAGVLQGLRIFSAVANSSVGDMSELGESLESFVYGIQFLEKTDANTKERLVTTINGATSRLFSNKASVVDPRTRVNYGYSKSIIPHWNDNVVSLLPIEGPFGTLHVYEDNIKTVADMITAVESDQNPDFPAFVEENHHLVNIVDFKNFDGTSYIAVDQVSGGNAVLLNDRSVIFAQGGGNGTMSNAAFNQACREQFTYFGEMEGLNFLDMLKYPFSHIYDSGYDIETKEALLSLGGRRKDLFLVVASQDVSMTQNTDDEESSIGVSLVNRARMFAESTMYGTEACRGMIVLQSGYMADGTYEHLLPVTYDLLHRFSRYMGAGNKRWDTNAQADAEPNNVITTLIKVNGTSRLEDNFSRDWKNGVTYARTWDRRSAFHPALRTYYPDETSILLSAITTMIAADLEKVAVLAWRGTVGNAKLNADERLEATENEVLSEVELRGYDNRVIVTADAYYTEEDRLNGNSCHVDIGLQADPMGTVTRFTVVAQRATSE